MLLTKFLVDSRFRRSFFKHYLQKDTLTNLFKFDKQRAFFKEVTTSMRYLRNLERLTGASVKDIKSYYKQLNTGGFNEYVLKQLLLKHKCQMHGDYFSHKGAFFMPIDYGNIIYAICRAVTPEIVIETGIHDGISTSYILKAMHDNKKGRLISVDKKYLSSKGRNIGWLIPEQLRDRSYFIVAKSMDCLPKLLSRFKSIDIFFHDSDHSYDNMMAEYKLAWPFIRKGGFLLSDDIFRNKAFFDFCSLNSVKRDDRQDFLKLGVIKK